MLDMDRRYLFNLFCSVLNADFTSPKANGWLYKLPSLDFAGGGPVHIASGWSALAYAFVLGERLPKGDKIHHKAHNPTLVFIGTVLIWFGWYGFNGGSALNGTIRSMLAAFNTNTAACFGVLGWVSVEYVRTKGKFSVVGACSGAIAGLVGITPAAGYVSLWIAALIGFLTGAICSLCQKVDRWIKIDEGMDVFKLHGIGGMVGSFLTGVFGQAWIYDLDGMGPYDCLGGMDGVGVQVGRQIAEIVTIAAYSFVVLCVLPHCRSLHIWIISIVATSRCTVDLMLNTLQLRATNMKTQSPGNDFVV